MTHRFDSSFVAAVLVSAIAVAARAQPVDVVKTNPMNVYMHYMPWFDTPAVLGGSQWGYHWRLQNQNPNIVDETGKRQIASHYYPLIGPYDSSDPHVVEYHLLLMKFSGIDGVLVDWYGVQGNNDDINRLLTNSNALVNHVDDVGLDFGVVLEDRFSANIGQAEANVAYLRDNYFNKTDYIRTGQDDDPLLMVFGPITFHEESQWTQILAEANEPVDFRTLWYESNEAGANADGEFAWIYEDEAADNHLTHQRNFYLARAPSLDAAGGVAYPGFDDFYEEGGVGDIIPFDIPHNDGQTLDQVLNLASAYAQNVDFLQLATFNDFGEGTMFEPTVETGFDYLRQVQQFTGTEYGEDELKLVYRLYLSRRRYLDNPTAQSGLDQVAQLLSSLEIVEARELLDSIAPPGDYDGDGNVGPDDYATWREAFGSQTVLLGSGADGNYDGLINAADFVVWRNGREVNALAAGAVPEPNTASLIGMLASALVLIRRR